MYKNFAPNIAYKENLTIKYLSRNFFKILNDDLLV